MTEEDKPQVIKDLEALDEALGELAENGTDAAEEAIEGAIGVLEALLDTDAGSDDEHAAANEALEDAKEALEAIAEGDADEDDVEYAGGVLASVGEEMQIYALKAAMGL